MEKNTLYCPTHYFDGQEWDFSALLNDQFYIGDYNCMKIISQFVTEHYNIERHGLNEPIYSNERNLRNFLNEKKIYIKILQDIKYKKDHNGFGRSSGGSQLENF